MKTFLKSMLTVLATTTAVWADDLNLTVYNPGADGMFPVTSVIVEGPNEVMLVDAQFEQKDAQAVLKLVQATGKPLKTIYISASDPDFYFGLDVFKAAYPEAEIIATAATVDSIKQTLDTKIAVWGPILGENAPSEYIVPSVFDGTTLSVDGVQIEITGPDPKRTFLWAPSEKTVFGGVLLYENQHVWMADSQTPESRQLWLESLDSVLALQPERIIPGHTLGTSSEGADIVSFTGGYVKAFEAEAEKAANSDELAAAMVALYPEFPADDGLSISTKVMKSEMQWP